MKINKMLFGAALLPTAISPIITLTGCSKIEGVKGISTKFEVMNYDTSPYGHYGRLKVNVVYEKNIKKISNIETYLINGTSVLLNMPLPIKENQPNVYTVKGTIAATAIDDSIFLIEYSYDEYLATETIQSSSGQSITNKYIYKVENFSFKDPTKL